MRWMLALVIAGAMLAAAPTAHADDDDADARRQELNELRQRFKERYPDLVRLKNEQKIGETYQGRIEAVKAGYLKQPIDPDADKDDEDVMTIGRFVALENKDRSRLYALLAREMEIEAKVVAARNAARAFEEARADHYVRDADGEWLTGKQWREKQEEKDN